MTGPAERGAAARTIVFLHAHPDDETLLTGGTIARLHAAGHRTVVVTATDGGSGLTASRPAGAPDLGVRRADELRAACAALGVDRLVRWGYPDSGPGDGGPPERFSAQPVTGVARELAALLVAERADALVGYDAAGGYGHPDHVQVHRVGALAAALAGTPLLLQATVDRQALQRALRLIQWLPGLPDGFRAAAFAGCYVEHAQLTHRVDVRSYTQLKRAAMLAHRSQQTADTGDRTLAWALRLPAPLFRAVFGREWFVEVGRDPRGVLLDDPLAGLALTSTTESVIEPLGRLPLAPRRQS